MSDIRLEPFGEQHHDAFRRMLEDPEVPRYTRVPEPVPDGFTEHWAAAYDVGRASRTKEAFAIVDATDQLLGIAVAPEIRRAERTAELGYVVASWARGRGVATQALRLLTEWAFQEQGMVRLFLLISVSNGPSKRVAANAGYRFEGVLRSLHFKQDLREDTESWSRLATD